MKVDSFHAYLFRYVAIVQESWWVRAARNGLQKVAADDLGHILDPSADAEETEEKPGRRTGVRALPFRTAGFEARS